MCFDVLTSSDWFCKTSQHSLKLLYFLLHLIFFATHHFPPSYWFFVFIKKEFYLRILAFAGSLLISNCYAYFIINGCVVVVGVRWIFLFKTHCCAHVVLLINKLFAMIMRLPINIFVFFFLFGKGDEVNFLTSALCMLTSFKI